MCWLKRQGKACNSLQSHHGAYPFHPITVWFLSNSTNMLQQRSAIAFASEMFDRYYVTTPKVTIDACDEGTKKLLNFDRSVETSFGKYLITPVV